MPLEQNYEKKGYLTGFSAKKHLKNAYIEGLHLKLYKFRLKRSSTQNETLIQGYRVFSRCRAPVEARWRKEALPA